MLHAARQLPAWLIFDVSQKTMRATLFIVFLLVLGTANAQPRSTYKVSAASGVIVSWLEGDIARGKASARLWESLPQVAAIPQFVVVPNLG